MLLHHTVSGSGPPLLMVHSTACDSRQWNAQREALAGDCTVITPDIRGYGRSALSAEPYSDAGDVLHLMDHLGLGAVTLVGSSGGGRVALQVATAAPDRVRSLILLCTAADVVEPTPALQAFAEREEALLAAGRLDEATELNADTWLGPEADDAARALLREMQAHAFRVQSAAGDDIHEEPSEVDLSRITAPTTVVAGLHDLDFFQITARHLATTLADASLFELPWAGHLPNLERPGDITALIAGRIEP